MSDDLVLYIIGGPLKGRQVRIPVGRKINIGRKEGIGLTLRDKALSRLHCMIEHVKPGYAIIKDLDSKNGTFVGHKRISEPEILTDGSMIKLGGSFLKVSLPDAPTEVEFDAANPAAEEEDTAFEADAVGTVSEGMEPALDQPAPAKAGKMVFCSVCSGSIPLVDILTGVAVEDGEYHICSDCLAKGITIEKLKAAGTDAGSKSAAARKMEEQFVVDDEQGTPDQVTAAPESLERANKSRRNAQAMKAILAEQLVKEGEQEAVSGIEKEKEDEDYEIEYEYEYEYVDGEDGVEDEEGETIEDVIEVEYSNEAEIDKYYDDAAETAAEEKIADTTAGEQEPVSRTNDKRPDNWRALLDKPVDFGFEPVED